MTTARTPIVTSTSAPSSEAEQVEVVETRTAGSESAREHGDRHDLRLTIPLDRMTDVALAPVAAARTVLPAKGGLPLYLGLAGLAAAGVVEWPVAAAAGIGYAGYAVLHRGPGPGRPGGGPAAEQRPSVGNVKAAADTSA
jgi:hypothetical protein